MKRIFSLICVLLLVCAAVSCSGKSSKGKPEQVTQQISAEKGGEIKSDDGETSIEIPGDALPKDVEITMTIRDAKDFPEIPGGKAKAISKVIEFGPDGTIFKKPFVIKTEVKQKIENKIITAAFYDGENWYYNHRGVVIINTNPNAGGDPIMETADGRQVGLDENGHLTVQVEGGDPIMFSNGDPIMLVAAGDPIMDSVAAGDPIMNAAAGDPIMMTAGHFSAYTFIALDPEGMQPCSETSGTPCMIWENAWSNEGLMWSSISDEKDWSSAKEYCEALNEAGYEHWRVPNINELRTLITNCEGSKAVKEGEAVEEGGKCQVSDPDALSSNARSDNCYCEIKEDGSYSILGDKDNVLLWSSSQLDGHDEKNIWSVNFASAEIDFVKATESHSVRCVRSEPYDPETEPDQETEPDSDSDSDPETEPDQETEPDSDPEETEPDSDNEPE